MDTKKLQLYFFIGLLLIVLALTVSLFIPFVSPLALAFMVAIVAKPLDRKILKTFRGKRTLAALATVIIVLIIILIPLSYLVQQVTVESYNFYTDVRDGNLGSFETLSNYVVEPIQKIIPDFNPDVRGYVQTLAANLANNASNIFSSTANIGLGIFIAVMALFYMLRDGHRLKRALIELSPLTDKYDRSIIEKIEVAVNSVVRGSLFTSLIKGALATLGFAIFGVPHALLWGILTAIVSLLPAIGAGLTIIPAALYLLVAGSLGGAIGLTVWGFVIVGLVDNIVMPLIVGRGLFTVHPLFVLLSVLGGVIVFGPVGLFLGPLIIALFAALLEIYKLIILDDSNKKETAI